MPNFSLNGIADSLGAVEVPLEKIPGLDLVALGEDESGATDADAPCSAHGP